MKKTFCLILSLCMMASVLVLPGCTKQDGDATPLFRGLDSGEMFLSGYTANNVISLISVLTIC